MKKYIYNLAALAFGMIAATSCSPIFQGEEEGNDSAPKAAIYQFTPTAADGDYDADTDLRVRITGNNKTQTAYYKAYKTDAFDAMSEAQVISDVKSTGASVSNPGAGTDVFVTGMQGANTIVVVATDGSKDVVTTSEFYGITWTTVAKGKLRTRFANMETTDYDYLENVELQINEDEGGKVYRLKNPWGTGVNLVMNINPDITDVELDADGYANEGDGDYFGYNGVPFRGILIPKTAVGFGDYAVGDYFSVRGSDYTYYCRLYKDYRVTCYSYWTKGSSNVSSGWTYFYPY